MRKSRFTEEQMVKSLREADAKPPAEVAKKHKVSTATLYAWRKRFGNMDAQDAKQLQAVQAENAKRKKLLQLGHRQTARGSRAFRCARAAIVHGAERRRSDRGDVRGGPGPGRTLRRRALREWALRIAVRRGKRIAVVALARKLAGVLYAMWRDGSEFAEPVGAKRALAA